MERAPDAIALIAEGHQFTYADLNARANRRAHHLLEFGVGPEVIVAVCLDRSVELIVSLLAILKAGGAYLPLATNLPGKRIQRILEVSQAAFVIGPWPDGAPVANMQFTTARHLPIPSNELNYSTQNQWVADLKSSCLAYVLFTSGTTGEPKGVSVEHGAIARRCSFYPGLWGLDADARVLAQSQINFDMATREWLLPLTVGASIVLASEEQQADPQKLAELISSHDCTHVAATPSRLEVMLNTGCMKGRLITAGGEKLAPSLLAQLDRVSPRSIVHSFGPSEASIACTMHCVTSADLASAFVPLGKPLPDTKLVVVGPGGQLCPIGVPGELHIGGAGLARGYLHDPILTDQKFIRDPLCCVPSDRLYKSGDLVSWNEEGSLIFHGRIDDQIKLRGFRIEPSEIETTLRAHAGVGQAVVVLRKEDPANPRLVAYWVKDPASCSALDATPGRLSSFVAERLPDYMVPAAFVQLDSLPLTANGKLDRQALPAPSFSGDLEQRVEPSGDLERQLHALWAEVLGHGEFGITDNVFQVGGHSLAMAALSAAVLRELGQPLPMVEIFRNPTIQAQVKWLSGHQPKPSTPNLVTLQPLGDRAPLVVVHGWGGTIGTFIHLARSLAPHRPVCGVQAAEEQAEPHGTVAAMAACYADQLLARHPGGPVHLLGFSAGGWYAHALAAALL
ncbi:MAG: amino acid adenylation domain-containing protein [Cyanobium sp.]